MSAVLPDRLRGNHGIDINGTAHLRPDAGEHGEGAVRTCNCHVAFAVLQSAQPIDDARPRSSAPALDSDLDPIANGDARRAVRHVEPHVDLERVDHHEDGIAAADVRTNAELALSAAHDSPCVRRRHGQLDPPRRGRSCRTQGGARRLLGGFGMMKRGVEGGLIVRRVPAATR